MDEGYSPGSTTRLSGSPPDEMHFTLPDIARPDTFHMTAINPAGPEHCQADDFSQPWTTCPNWMVSTLSSSWNGHPFVSPYAMFAAGPGGQFGYFPSKNHNSLEYSMETLLGLPGPGALKMDAETPPSDFVDDVAAPSLSDVMHSNLEAMEKMTLSDMDKSSLKELYQAAEACRKERLRQGITQDQMGKMMSRVGPSPAEFSQTTISRFETCKLSLRNMVKLRPMLETILTTGATATSYEDIKKALPAPPKPVKQRKKRTVVDGNVTRRLNAIFETTPHPTKRDLMEIAGALYLQFDYVRHWFNNRRARGKRTTGDFDDKVDTKFSD